MEIRRCMKCMHELRPGESVCPACGAAYGSWRAESFALKPGTILDGKYLVGEMLGQGGFGITYIGFDLLLEQKVATKEYFPMSTGMVSRENQSSVVWSSTMMEKTGAEKGFDSFLKEARKMAKLGDIPNVVGVKSVFIQNETAYIVMDFIEGETLQRKLQREGPMDFDTCVSLLAPIMQALAEVHQHGIIHRDISPDNLMVRKDGRLVLLDLGAAKDLDIQAADGTVQSSQLVAKQGFSPFEQYGKTWKTGPWTDVYAMAATIYYCCTGSLPPSSIDRIAADTLTCKPLLTQAQFDALAVCMTVLPEKRPQSMDAMLKIIGHTAEPKREPSKPDPVKAEPPKTQPPKPKLQKPQPPNRKSPMPKWLIPVAAVGIAVLAIGIGISGKKQPDTAAGKSTAPQTIPTEGTAVQTVPTESAPGETVPVEVHVMAAAEDLSGIAHIAQSDQQPFWGQTQYKRGDIETVTFQSTLEGAPDSAWDVSEAGDRSILAWMDGSALYVAANGKIAPNPNASFMFAWLHNLKEINFGDCFDTSNVTDMHSMFSRCFGLTSLDLSSFDTSNVTDMSGMFSRCGLASPDLSSFDTSNVTDMNWMFYGCTNLASLDLSSFDTSNVTDMNGMFDWCINLAGLDLSSFDTSNVTDMRGMFYGCRSLTSLDLSSFSTANVTNMFQLFYRCSSLANLDVSGFDTENVTDMRSMFYGCRSLTNLQGSDSQILKLYQQR